MFQVTNKRNLSWEDLDAAKNLKIKTEPSQITTQNYQPHNKRMLQISTVRVKDVTILGGDGVPLRIEHKI